MGIGRRLEPVMPTGLILSGVRRNIFPRCQFRQFTEVLSRIHSEASGEGQLNRQLTVVGRQASLPLLSGNYLPP